HHRAAAASRVAEARGRKDEYFLTVLLPQREMTILDYNRVLRDLSGLTPSEGPAVPARADEIGMFLAGRWRRLRLKPDVAAQCAQTDDPVARLPVVLIAKNILEPVFGVSDQRRDKRIAFVGGARGLGELELLVSSGAFAVA